MKLKKENKGGIIGTVVVNVSIIVLLFFLGFHTELPLPEEEGILINFGYNETGLGEIEPEVKEEQVVEQVEATSSEEEIVTSELDDTPEVADHKDTNTEETEEVQEEKEEQRVVNPNVLFPPTDNSNNSNSQGIAGGNGNQGDPDGGNSDSYTGHGQGDSGISYSLKGRHHKGLPKPVYTANEGGKVVVEITVNRNGIVTSATPGIKGTTTSASNLWAAAKKAAMKTKFDKSSSSPKMQTGSITYHFVLR